MPPCTDKAHIFSSDAPAVIAACIMTGTLLTVTPRGCEVDSGGMEETDSSSRDIVLVTSGTGLMSL